MIQTTYNLLIDDDTDSNFIQQMESITGAKEVYGLDTPINLIDVLDNLGLEPTMTCFYRSTTDNTELSKVIGIAWVNAHNYAYAATLPDDSRVNDIMYYCSLYLQEGAITPRVDYCGNDLTGPGLIPLSQITDLAASILATISALPLIQQATSYLMLIANTGPMTDAQYNSYLNGGQVIAINRTPIIDPAIQVPNGTTGYTEQSISALSSNPDVFVNVNFTYTSDSTYYYLATWQNQSTNGSGTSIIPAYGNRSAYEIGQAAIYASQQITDDTGFLLAQICNQIRVAIADYNQQQLSLLAPKRSRYQQFASGIPATGSGIAEWDADGQTVMDAGLNKRAELLRDPAFLATFDTDFSGSLSSAELVNAEKAVQAEMLTARKAAGQALYDAVNAQFVALDTITDTLAAVMRPYLL
jgi:hypothetical protein